jgi:YegS/Rv2252/BmrU family lipid kinase
MRHLFIVNPVAGGKKNKHQELIASISTVMSEKSDPFEIYVTRAPLDACEKIKNEAESHEPMRVYAVGGDGTLNECVNGAAGFGHVAVTHFPCGTGNDFVKMFGADTARFSDLPALLGGFVRPLDLIDVRTESGEVRYGLNICSIGIDARIGTDVHKYSAIPVIGGATGYVVSLVVNLLRGVNQRFKITAGDSVMDGSFALVCACNGRYYGGGFNPVPDAMPDDGILDFLIVREVSRLKFLRIVGKYAKGRFKEIGDIITYIRGTLLTIKCAEEMAVNVDGELLRSKEVTFRLVPRGVNFLFPSGLGFFGAASTPYAANASN